MQPNELFAHYGFTNEQSHTCADTGNPMRAFYAHGDPYKETACYLDLVTGEVEVDVGGGCEYLGDFDCENANLISALEFARGDIQSYREGY